MKLRCRLNLFRFKAQIWTCFVLTRTITTKVQFTSFNWLIFAPLLREISLTLLQVIQVFYWLINIHIFNNPDSRLSGQFISVPTTPDNRGWTVQPFSFLLSALFVSLKQVWHVLQWQLTCVFFWFCVAFMSANPNPNPKSFQGPRGSCCSN